MSQRVNELLELGARDGSRVPGIGIGSGSTHTYYLKRACLRDKLGMKWALKKWGDLADNNSMYNSSPPAAVQRLELFETQLTVIRQEWEAAVNQPPVRCVITLGQMLHKYMFALGYQNNHLLEVLIALMTTGKICVEFRNYNERLELKDPLKMMTRPATIQLFNEYLASVKADKKVILGSERTQKITVQLPKIAGATSSGKLVAPQA